MIITKVNEIRVGRCTVSLKTEIPERWPYLTACRDFGYRVQKLVV